MTKVKGARPYRSERREQQAAATRLAIVEAARRLFVDRGYSGTTVDAIAAEAGVAAVTVYATFGSKRGVLNHLVDVSVGGDERPIRLLDREGPRAVAHETDQRRQVAMFAAGIAEIMARMSPVFEVLRLAAPGDQEIALLLERLHRGRLEGMTFFVNSVAANGPLRKGLTRRVAAETVWALSSPDVHRLLTVRLGWSSDQYMKWLRDTVAAAVLPD